jgi:hypothetical protein
VIDPNHDPAGAAAEPFAANSRQPIPLETDFFSGHALLLVRPEKPAVRHRRSQRRLFTLAPSSAPLRSAAAPAPPFTPVRIFRFAG